jgi:hypothetical protein
MKIIDRALWLCGLLALVWIVVYWPTIVAAYKNRAAIGAAAGVANDLKGAGLSL